MNNCIHKTIFLLSFITCSIVLIPACNNQKCTDGNNQTISQTRHIENGFNEISLSSGFTVYVTVSHKDSLTVQAESNLMKDIITDIKGNRLEISTLNNTCLNPRKPVVIKVYAKNINLFEVSGSGYIQTDSMICPRLCLNVSGSGTIKADSYVNCLEATVSGSGNIEIWGKTVSSIMTISGSGNITSYGLNQDSCSAVLSGSGSLYLFSKKTLNASISGSGSVFYKGNPTVNMHISGSGKVISQKSIGSQGYYYSGSVNSIPSKSMFFIY